MRAIDHQLLTAIGEDSAGLAQVALLAGADANGRDQGRPFFLRTAEKCSPPLLRLLAAHGADPRALDEDGHDAIMRALIAQKPQNVPVLLELGSAPDARSASGASGALFAASYGHAEALDALALAGAPLDAAGSMSAAMMAAYGGHLDCLRVLARHGADFKAQFNGNDASHLAAIANHRDCWGFIQTHLCKAELGAQIAQAAPATKRPRM